MVLEMWWNAVNLLILTIGKAVCWTAALPLGIIRAVVKLPGQGGELAVEQQGEMSRFWQAEPEWLILWLSALAILVAVAAYVIGKIRPKAVQKERRANQWLSKYREMHSRGELTDEEFRTIKTKLAQQLQDELKDNGEES